MDFVQDVRTAEMSGALTLSQTLFQGLAVLTLPTEPCQLRDDYCPISQTRKLKARELGTCPRLAMSCNALNVYTVLFFQTVSRSYPVPKMAKNSKKDVAEFGL